MKAEIDKLVRDICKVQPMPKSEARRRIKEILTKAKEEERKEWLEGEKCWECGDKMPGSETSDTCWKCLEEN